MNINNNIIIILLFDYVICNIHCPLCFRHIVLHDGIVFVVASVVTVVVSVALASSHHSNMNNIN
jgi:hypothetical protein